MDAAGIRDITIFAAFDETQRTRIAGACQELEVEEGATLTEQGEFGYAMFAVTSGTADVFKDGKLVRTLGAGHVFGDTAVFFGGQLTATVVATSPMRLGMLFNGQLHASTVRCPRSGRPADDRPGAAREPPGAAPSPY